jgi:hypothetical protein
MLCDPKSPGVSYYPDRGVFHFGSQILGTSGRSATLLAHMAEHLRHLSNTPRRPFKERPMMTTYDGMDLFNLIVIVVEREGAGAMNVFNFDVGAAAIVGTVAIG